MKQVVFIFAFLISSTALYGQNAINGKVLSNQNKSLAFVNIIVNNNHHQGVITDIDGNFELSNVEMNDTLTLTYIGYQASKFVVTKLDLKRPILIFMTESTVALGAVTVFAGENPAHRIIRNVVKNRKQNNPDKYEQYSCKTYNKMRFATVPDIPLFKEDAAKKEAETGEKTPDYQLEVMQSRQNFADSFYLTVMETVTEKQFNYPNSHKEIILHNKVAGLKKPDFVSLAKDIQPFSFYAPSIKILEETYINPISKGSTNIYYFNWTDTLITEQDTVFIITFQPKEGRTFEGLKGVLYIHSNGYAIQNVIAEPADLVKTYIKIEQKYLYHSSSQKWFPEQLNMEWFMGEYPSKYLGMKIDGKSYITSVDFNPQFKNRHFTRDRYEMSPNVFDLDINEWDEFRVDSLTQKERATYGHIDSVSKEYYVEAQMKGMEVLTSGKWDIGKIDIDLEKLIILNTYENVRIGLGFQTNEKLLKNISIGGYAGYGWKDKTWKYGGNTRFEISRKYHAHLTAGYANDLQTPAQPNLPRWKVPFSESIQDLFQPVLDQNEMFYAQLEHRFLKNGNVEWAFKNQTITPNNEYAFLKNNTEINTFRFNEMSFKLRYAYGEQTVTFMGVETPKVTRFPIVHLNVTNGWWQLSDENLPYQRYTLGIEQRLPLHRLGHFEYSMEAGFQSGDVPLAKLFLSRGLGSGLKIYFISNTFQTMQPNEFVSDQFVHLFLRWTIGTLTKKSVYFQPKVAVIHNLAFGQLTTSLDNHLNLPLKTLEKGFFESGLEVNNVYRFNYLNIAYLGLGGGVYYRHGANQLPTLEENIGYRFLLSFSF